MRRPEAVLLLLGGAAALALHPAALAAGLATRDLNPITQGLYLPSTIPAGGAAGWRVEHLLWVTNTLQDESRGGETLRIDVENLRYQLGLTWRGDPWLLRIDLPASTSSAGELDTLIEDWHDFFGFPQGKRDELPKDRLEISYRRGGTVEFAQHSDSGGLGDVALALGYRLRPALTGFVGIELPTGSIDDYTGNEAVDVAIWLGGERERGETLRLYGLFGLAFPGDGDLLDGLVADLIPVAQAGLEYRFTERYAGMLQFDAHGAWLEDSDLRAFGESLQLQVGLGLIDLLPGCRIDLFFSEDVSVGSAPDISFGLRLQNLD